MPVISEEVAAILFGIHQDNKLGPADKRGKEIKSPCAIPTVMTSKDDWDYTATAEVYCPHCYHMQSHDIQKDLPQEGDLAEVIGCEHCGETFAVRGVQTIVWDVATDLRRLCDDELGPKE